MMRESKTKILSFIGLFSLILGVLMLVLDGTLMNVSMVAIARDLNITIASLQTLITVYSLVMASLMLIGGKLGDILGRKKMFMVGAFLFTLGSLIAATAYSSLQLLIGWSVVEGVGAALMMPASTSIIVNSFKGKDRALAFGLWGATASAGAALGPIVGGYLTSYYSWRYAFSIQVLLGVLVLITAIFLKESRGHKKGSFDFVGAVLSALTFGFLVFYFLKAREYGWFYAKKSVDLFGINLNLFGLSFGFILAILGILLLIFLYIYEKGQDDPVLDFRLFKNKAFAAGIFTAFMLTLAQAGFFFIVPIYLQVLFGLDAFHTGLYLLPITIAVFIASAGLSRSRARPVLIIRTGLALTLLGIILLVWAIDITLIRLRFVIAFVVLGLGIGAVMAKLTNIIMSSVKESQAGEASGLNSALRRLGSSMGTAILGTIFFESVDKRLRKLFLDPSWTEVIPVSFRARVSMAVKMFMEKSSQLDLRVIMHFLKASPKEIYNALYPRIVEITVQSARETLFVSAGFMILVILSSLWLKDTKDSSLKNRIKVKK